jgi:4-hydroxy-tetrahydrodipicolinate synthase
LRGIVTVLNTPFTASDAIDFEGLRKNVANAIEAGVAGFLVPAMASEVNQLTSNERHQIVAEVVTQVDSRVTVIGGAAATTQQERLDLTRELIDLGCDGILVPVEPEADPTLIERQLIEIADLEPQFLMVQDWDSAGPGLALETIVRLFHNIEPFKWLKIEVQDAGPKYTRVLNETQGDLGVAGGWAVAQMIDGLDRGVHVFMPTAMHSIYVEIYRRYAVGDRAAAVQLFKAIEPVLAFSNQQLDISIRFFKQMLYAQGVYTTPNVRIEGAPLNPDQQQIAAELIRAVNAIQRELAS